MLEAAISLEFVDKGTNKFSLCFEFCFAIDSHKRLWKLRILMIYYL